MLSWSQRHLPFVSYFGWMIFFFTDVECILGFFRFLFSWFAALSFQANKFHCKTMCESMHTRKKKWSQWSNESWNKRKCIKRIFQHWERSIQYPHRRRRIIYTLIYNAWKWEKKENDCRLKQLKTKRINSSQICTFNAIHF